MSIVEYPLVGDVGLWMLAVSGSWEQNWIFDYASLVCLNVTLPPLPSDPTRRIPVREIRGS